MTEISRYGTGERGVFKIEVERPEGPVRIDKELLERDIERGTWWYNRSTEKIEKYVEPEKVYTHAVIQDTLMTPRESLVTRNLQKFDSRSALRNHLKERGYSEISTKELKQEWARDAAEVNKRTAFDWREHKEDWERAENDIRYGNVEIDEREKERCRQEERQYQNYKKRLKTEWAS